MKINVLNIDFTKAYETDELYLEFSIEDPSIEEVDIKLEILDPFFDRPFAFVEPMMFNCSSGIFYWASFWLKGQTRDPVLGLQGGFTIKFSSPINDEIFFVKTFHNKGKFWKKRELSFDFPYSHPRFILVGDSHSWTNFGDYEKNIKSVSGFSFIRHSHYGVSSHTFWGGDFLGFINMIPIENCDIIGFNFGTYDFRKGVFKASQNKNMPLEECVYATLFQTFYRLKELRNLFPNNHFVISSVMPPIRENHIEQSRRKEFFWNSSDLDRMKVFKMYKNFWERHIHLIENCSFLDWSFDYIDNEGFIKNENLCLGDYHIYNHEFGYRRLEELLTKINNELKLF